MRSVQVLPVAVGITLCTVSVALFYKWYSTKNIKDVVDGAPQPKLSGKEKRAKKRTEKIELTISNEKLPVVIGRAGANIKSIEEKTNAKIEFRDKDDKNQLCTITGPYENVMKAANLINDEIKRSECVKEEIIILKSTYDKINFKILKEICRDTGTKIRLSGLKDKNRRQLEISGPIVNVQKAKRCIEEYEHQHKIDLENDTKREPRYSPKISPTNSSMESLSKQSSSPQPTLSSGVLTNIENFSKMPSRLGGQMEVYVSAVASPARFWVQIVGSQISKLDELTAEMTEYYSQIENQEKHRINDPYLGQIVAAMFQYDNKWYRATIVAIVPNDYDPRKVALDLYFLDFGDSIYVDPNDVFELRTDFLTLRYQAIECFLANVSPVHPLEGGQWNHDAINRFEDLTHVAKWKKLTARTVKTRERVRGLDPNSRESSTVPGIELYDVIEDRDVNLASILILENFAVPSNQDDTPTPLSRYSSSESVLRLDGGSSGSVAEKALMFELTAHIQNNRNSPKLHPNGTNDGQKSPSRFSPSRFSPRKTLPNENLKNAENGTEEKSNDVQDLLTEQMLGNRSWADIMDAES